MTTQQEKILQEARSVIGPVEYQYQLKDEQVTKTITNCARFLQLLFYKYLGIRLGPSSLDQAADDGKKIGIPLDIKYPFESKEKGAYYQLLLTRIEPADLVFFEGKKGSYNYKRLPERVGHVALYSGDGNVIHCFRDEDRGPGEIKEEPLWKVIEKKGPVVIVKRILEDK